MTSTDRPAGAFQDPQLPVPVKLAAAWASFMFLYAYVDILGLYKPGHVEEILAGVVHEFETGPTFVSLALTALAVPSVMIMLSATLPARANRTVNLVVATLYVPFTVYNVSGEETWDYAWFYGLSIGLEVLLLAYVLRTAWTWPRTAPASVEQARVPVQA